LSRQDFFEIYLPLTRMGLQLTVYTNGTLITPEIGRRFADSPPHSIEITLYGATEATYERVTGIKGSYSRCLAGIRTLLSAGITTLKLKTTLCRQNHHELEQMIAVSKSFGVPFTSAWLLTQGRDFKIANLDNFRLNLQQVSCVESFYRARNGGKEKDLYKNDQLPTSDGAFWCNAGKCSFNITAEGHMTPCNDISNPATHPLSPTGFLAAWEKLRSMMQNIKKSSTCNETTCRFFDFCPWCPARSFVETATFSDPVPYFCEIAQSRHAFWNGEGV